MARIRRSAADAGALQPSDHGVASSTVCSARCQRRPAAQDPWRQVDEQFVHQPGAQKCQPVSVSRRPRHAVRSRRTWPAFRAGARDRRGCRRRAGDQLGACGRQRPGGSAAPTPVATIVRPGPASSRPGGNRNARSPPPPAPAGPPVGTPHVQPGSSASTVPMRSTAPGWRRQAWSSARPPVIQRLAAGFSASRPSRYGSLQPHPRRRAGTREKKPDVPPARRRKRPRRRPSSGLRYGAHSDVPRRWRRVGNRVDRTTTTRLTRAATSASQQGGVRPWVGAGLECDPDRGTRGVVAGVLRRAAPPLRHSRVAAGPSTRAARRCRRRSPHAGLVCSNADRRLASARASWRRSRSSGVRGMAASSLAGERRLVGASRVFIIGRDRPGQSYATKPSPPLDDQIVLVRECRRHAGVIERVRLVAAGGRAGCAPAR